MMLSEQVRDRSPVDLAAVDLAAVERLGQTVRAQLEAKRAEIYSEIRHYPPPIPACDQQFNYLLEQRGKLAQEIQQVDAILKAVLPSADALIALRDLMRSSAFINAQSAQTLLD